MDKYYYLRKLTYILYVIVFSIEFVVGTKTIFDVADSELTITVNPGMIECYYQKATTGETLEIEYQVTDATFGDVEIQHDLDINFQLYSPQGRELISDFKQPDAMHRINVKEEGDYKLCFDNTYSTFSHKTVYFEVYVDSGTDQEDWFADGFNDFTFSPEIVYNDTTDQIKNSIAKVKDHLSKVKHFQDQLRAIETRDRNLQEHNFTRVNQFSMVIICVMVIVGAVQVLMLKSLFEEKSKLHRIFKLLS